MIHEYTFDSRWVREPRKRDPAFPVDPTPYQKLLIRIEDRGRYEVLRLYERETSFGTIVEKEFDTNRGRALPDMPRVLRTHIHKLRGSVNGELIRTVEDLANSA